MTYRKEMGHNNGFTRVIRIVTIVLLVLWSYLMLGAQINSTAFIQCKTDDCTMEMTRCITLLIGYAVCFAPIAVCWIVDGFKQDKYYHL